LFAFGSAVASYIPLRRGPHQWKPSDSALVLQDGSVPFYDFLARILGVGTPLFLFNIEFYFSLSSLLVHKSHKSRHTYIAGDSSVCSMFASGVGSWGSIPKEVIFLMAMSIMALEAVKFNLFFKSLHLFILFLPLFTFENFLILLSHYM
jgi:hypothetical protein